MDRFGVSRAVLIQHLGEFDNHYIENVVAADPDRFAGIFMVDKEDPASKDQVIRWARNGVLRGIRFESSSIDIRPDLWHTAAECELPIVVYNETTFSHHITQIAAFAAGNPQTKIVLTHLGIPHRPNTPPQRGDETLFQLAKHPSVFVQISGMHMYCPPPYEILVPWIQRLAAVFGAERLLYGSNYPVMNKDTLYGEEIDLLRTGKLGIHPVEMKHVLHDTARALWFGGEPPASP